MPTPEFVVRLRASIGHDLLWLTGVTGYVEDRDGRILLARRSDTGEWALVYGINEPGEEPADTVAREIKEETGIDAVATDLVSVKSSTHVVAYKNGDRAMYMDHLFLCTLAPGGNDIPFVGDEESLAVGWFPPDGLPRPLAETTVERLEYVRRYKNRAAQGDSHAQFSFDGAIRCRNHTATNPNLAHDAPSARSPSPCARPLGGDG